MRTSWALAALASFALGGVCGAQPPSGGCAIDNPRYAGFPTTIASHRFLVITTAGAAPEGAPRRQATADDLEA